jgi:hypothetical protein
VAINVQPISRLLDKLYLPNGYVQLIRRLTGLWLLGILPIEFHYCFYELPYRVPGWRFGLWTLELPAAPLWLDGFFWFAYALSALWLMFGSKSRIIAFVPAAVLFYFGSHERLAFGCSYTIMLFIYLVALLFYREPLSCTRRLIQFGVSTCYFFAAVNKLFPDFLSGETLNEIFNHCWMLKPFWHPFAARFETPPLILAALSLVTPAVEAFIALGLWHRKTRIYAVILGVLLHAGIFIFIDDVDVFASVMLTGYLAFFDKRSAVHTTGGLPEQSGFSLDKLLAAGCLLIMLWLPLRFYIPLGPTGRPVSLLSHFDHAPWGWGMFMFREQIESVKAGFLTADGLWHEVELKERMTRASSDDEMLAMARFILRQQPDAQEATVEICLRVNSRRLLIKTCQYSRSDNGVRKIEVRQR